VDQFHVGGFEATEKLAQLLCPSQGSCVLEMVRDWADPRGILQRHVLL
jgi:hypothetical protein